MRRVRLFAFVIVLCAGCSKQPECTVSLGQEGNRSRVTATGSTKKLALDRATLSACEQYCKIDRNPVACAPRCAADAASGKNGAEVSCTE
jgi:hypothetical protein